VNGVRPTATFGHSREGTCGVCGAYGRLSWTHVPPRCAGNVQSASRLVTAPHGHGEVVTVGRELQGGCAGYFLCERCNNDAGNWYDSAFGALWNHLAKRLLVEEGMPPYGGPHLLSISGVEAPWPPVPVQPPRNLWHD
jgi:hypothetical protein